MNKVVLFAISFLVLSVATLAADDADSSDPKLIDTDSSAATQEASAAGSDWTTTESPSEEGLLALKTEPDSYGIPAGIYQYDRLLQQYESAVRRSKSNSVLWGGIGGGLVALGLILAAAAPEVVWAPYGTMTSVPWGYVLAGLGGTVIVVDLVLIVPGVPRNKKLLRSTFDTRYGSYME